MSFVDELARRMARPQRHRLLQGFPAVPAMVPISPRDDNDLGGHFGRKRRRHLDGSLERSLGRGVDGTLEDSVDDSEPPLLTVDRTRGLIVGVIPHTQCVPQREACGFCTFPHDTAGKRSREEMVEAVARDIDTLCAGEHLRGRRVDAIYLGGGTANLASPEEIGLLVQCLGKHLDIADAELSLEGTPALFAQWFSSHLKNLARQPCSHRRISMGIQTFDAGFLGQMGRARFGDAALVAKIVKRCRDLDITTSGDLLFNLPGQSDAQMDADVDTAVACGLDQICLYNLVLYEGLGTPWSEDPQLVRQMPDNATACASWLRLRDKLLNAGYVQSTLTNFERADVAHGPRGFRYEVASFTPEGFDGVGFGPLSISTVVDWPGLRGLKLMRRKSVARPPWSGDDLYFRYGPEDLRLLFLTRSLAKTSFSRATYRTLFGSDVTDDFAAPLAALSAEGLLAVDGDTDGDTVTLSPRGMFFSDAVVSLLALDTARTTLTAGSGVHTRDLLAEQPRAVDYISMG